MKTNDLNKKIDLLFSINSTINNTLTELTVGR